MVMRLVRTEAVIPASAERVWAVLTDFSRYAEWNPLNTSAKGEGRLGARIPMTIFNPLEPGKPMKMTMTISMFEPGKALAWVGSIPLIFRGEHSFVLTPESGGTRMEHSEAISGLITQRITAEVVSQEFVRAYEAMNRALAERLGNAT
jgi:hypothetical protein